MRPARHQLIWSADPPCCFIRGLVAVGALEALEESVSGERVLLGADALDNVGSKRAADLGGAQ